MMMNAFLYIDQEEYLMMTISELFFLMFVVVFVYMEVLKDIFRQILMLFYQLLIDHSNSFRQYYRLKTMNSVVEMVELKDSQ